MNLAIAFANCAEKHAQKIAIFYGEREISYAELLRNRKKSPRICKKFDVKPGDRVGLWLKNCPEFAACVFGILQTGAVVVPINNFLKPAEVGYILNDGGIDVLISRRGIKRAFFGTVRRAART
jgi:long-chain acyl-CoA synthetase